MPMPKLPWTALDAVNQALSIGLRHHGSSKVSRRNLHQVIGRFEGQLECTFPYPATVMPHRAGLGS